MTPTWLSGESPPSAKPPKLSPAYGLSRRVDGRLREIRDVAEERKLHPAEARLAGGLPSVVFIVIVCKFTDPHGMHAAVINLFNEFVAG
jgi:hypothetical protein